MYGKNNPSPKKRLIIEGLKMGKNFSDLAADLSITKATAEVYGIDGLAVGQQISSIRGYVDEQKWGVNGVYGVNDEIVITSKSVKLNQF